MRKEAYDNIGLSHASGGATTYGPSITKGEFANQLTAVTEVVHRLALAPLEQAVRACEALSTDEPIDLAVLGQFKSGKSSLLNAVLGEPVLPVGALPVTAIITRVSAGAERIVRVAYLDGTVEEVAFDRLPEFATEAGNPGNSRNVAVVDVLTWAMRDLPGVRLVDTPGLGSVFTHNTETTRGWMPHVAAAMVTVSAERPLSDEDLRLIAEARQTAPRVVVLLTKVDLVTEAEREQLTDFLERTLFEKFGTITLVLPFSARAETERWLDQLRQKILRPLATNVAGERNAALALKLSALTESCRDYLAVGIQAAERNESDRGRLRAAVFTEKVSFAVIQDELRLAEEGIRAGIRSAFEQYFLSKQKETSRNIGDALSIELLSWEGNLAKQARRYEAWIEKCLLAELTPLSADAASVANLLIKNAEDRFRRIVDAFRDRLSRNINEAVGVSLSPIAWEATRPELAVIPINVGQTFMVHWDLLWWLLPMPFVRGFFRRHAVNKVPVEVETNLRRLVSEWANAVEHTIGALRSQATNWAETELSTLDRLLAKQPVESSILREMRSSLDSFVDPEELQT